MVLADSQGIPVGVTVHSASPAEVTLIEATLDLSQTLARRTPQRLIADKAYDSDGLREQLADRGIEQITPHRRNRRRPSRQDGRPLRRYRHRWIIERTIAWLGSFRRVHTRWDRSVAIYTGFVHLACVLVSCRYL
jgi:transposase